MSAALVLARKEVRAQAAIWLAIVVAMLAGDLPSLDMRDFGVVLYVTGALALGASSMGHEYRHGTLTQLLSHPIRRPAILLVKLAVLAGLLLAYAAVGAATVFSRLSPRADRETVTALFVLPLLYGSVVAPWLTLKTRSTLAGTLFSGSLAGLLYVSVDRIGAWRFRSPAEIDAFRLSVMWIGSWLVAVACGVALWRAFQALEVLDGSRSDIAVPAAWRAGRASVLTRRHPLLLLVVKELRLQQLAFVASLIYGVLYLALWLRRASLTPEDAVAVASATQAMVVAALVGALSCAEERGLGTLDSQLLQPIAARVQFAVKAAVTVALTLGLAIGLPALLWYTLGRPAGWAPVGNGGIAGVVIVLLAGSMYLSSVAGSALVAFFACVPAFMVTFWFVVNVAAGVAAATFRLLHRVPDGATSLMPPASVGVEVVVWGILVLLALQFAFENYRDSERSLRRAAGQLVGLALALTVAFAAVAAAGRLL